MTVERAEKAAAGAAALLLLASAARAGDLPKGGPGDCFEKVRIPATFRTVDESVPRPPLVTYREHPAEYAPETRQVLVRPARTVYERRPPVYKTVEVWRTEPGATRLVRTPAVYRTVSERTLIEPEHLAWRHGQARRGFEAGGEGVSVLPTGEVICRVLVPARYATVRRRVMVAPSATRRVRGPARKILCYERVEVSPGARIPHEVPAVYKTVAGRRLVKAASRERIETPQPPRIVHKRVEDQPARYAWRKIACKAPARPAKRSVERG